MPKRVLCCGTFDHVHPGHEAFLRQAAQLGDELVVVVARDENVQRLKGRLPDHDEQTRLADIQALGIAHKVQLGYAGKNLLQVVMDIGPDIIALGYDQSKPPGLEAHFPQCELVVLDAFHPDRYKSSFIRLQKNGPQ
jgi:cytidyltransferase-like protein